jgi:archaellum biogenesis ATPase FlaH
MENKSVESPALAFLRHKKEKSKLNNGNDQENPNTIKTAEDLLALNIDSIPMLLPPILQQSGVAALSGSSDVGKSYLCLNLAISICSGDTSSLGFILNPIHKKVLIVCTEDSEAEVSVRLKSFEKSKMLIPGSLRFVFQPENLLTILRKELSENPVDLVVIDTFGDVFTGSINQSIEVRTFLKPYKKLAASFGCLIVFSHHIGKGKESNNLPSKNDVLGSQAIESACRMVLMLRKNPDGKRILTSVKGNNIPDEFKDKGIILDFDVVSGFSQTGDVIDFRSNPNLDNELIQKVIELRSSIPKPSLEKVAQNLKLQGYKIDKNKVMKIWNTYLASIQNPKENDG